MGGLGGAGPSDADAGQVEDGLGVVLHRERHLEERVAGQRAGGGQLLDEPLERHVLVGEGRQAALADPGQQIAEGRVSGQVGPEHERVDEEADQVVEGLVRASGVHRADRYVRTGSQPREQDAERRLEEHGHGHAFGAGHGQQPLVHLGRNGEGHPVALVAGDRGTGVVEGQRELVGDPRECLAPVLHLAGDQAVGAGFVAEQLALPQRVVRVLHRQRLPCGGPARAARLVRDGQVAGQRPGRPAVTRDVMHGHHEDVLVGAGREQPRPERGLGREVERVPRRPLDRTGQLRRRDLHDLELPGQFVGVEDLLVRLAVRDGEDRAQHLVPADDVPQGGVQRLGVHGSVQADGDGDVVGGARAFQLSDEPQTALGRGQRYPRGAFPRGQCDPRPVGAGQLCGQAGHRGGLEQDPDLDLDAEHRADPADQPDREEGVAAQLEEVVVDAHLGQAEDFGEGRAQDLLLGARRPPAGARGGRVLRGGQRLAVQLAVARQRQCVEQDDGRGHHVLGQSLGGELPDGRGQGRLVGLVVQGDEVGDQTGVAGGVLAGDHRGLLDQWVRGQHGLHFTRLDAEAADLDLVVGPAQVHDLAVGRPAGPVAGAVHACTGVVGAGDEPFRREGGPADVPAGQLGARDVQLAGDAGRHGAQSRVEDVQTGVGHRRADGHDAVGDLLRGEGGGGDADRGLGGAVVVEDPAAGAGGDGDEFAHPGGCRGLAAEDDGAGGQDRGQAARGTERGQVGGDHLEVVDAVFGEVAGDGHRVGDRVLVQDVERAAGDQAGEDDGVAEVGCLGLEQGVLVALAAESDASGHGGDVVGEGPMGDGDALGPAGRAGGVDDVGQFVGGGPDVRCLLRFHGQLHHDEGVVDGDGADLARGELVNDVLGAQQEDGPGVGEHEGDALGRLLGIHRQITGPRLPHRQDRDDRLHTPRQAQTHHGLRTHPLTHQIPRQTVRPRIQLRVRHLHTTGHHGHRLRRPHHLRLEQTHHRTHNRLDRRVVPLHQHPTTLRLLKHLDVGDPLLRIGGEDVEDVRPGGGDPVGGAGVEEVRGHRDRAVEPGGGALGVELLGDEDVEVELGRGEPGRHPAGPDRPEVQYGLDGVLHGQDGLEERVAGQGAGRGQLLDEPVERHVLVGHPGESGLADPGEHVGEGRVPGDVGSQYHGVDEASDEVVEGDVGAARVGGADRDVGTGAQPGQEHGQCGLEHHEGGDALGAGHVQQTGVDLRGHRERRGVPAVRGDGGTRVVEGQGQLLRRPGEDLAPVLHLTGDQAVGVGLVAEQLALPQRVVRVLHRQRLPLRGPARAARLVRHGQVTGQRPGRPAVTRDVVDDHDEDVLVGRDGPQPGLDGQVGREVEGVAGGLGDEGVDVRRGTLGRAQRPRQPVGVEDLLVRLAVGDGEDRAQHLVPADDVPQGGVQRLGVHGAPQTQRHGDVVGRGRALQLSDDPQAALGEGQRDALGALLRGQCGPGPVGAVEAGGEPGHRRGLEQGAQRDLDAEDGTDPADEPRREEGVTAQGEEVVLHAHPVDAEDLGEHGSEQLLLERGGPAAAARGTVRVVGGGQRPAVDLAVGGQRQGFQDHHGGRDHVGGQPSGEVGAQRGRQLRVGVARRDDVRDEPLVPRGVLTDDDRGLRDLGVLGHHGLHLARLHAEAAHLDLVVGAPDEDETAVGAPADLVAGAVHARTRLVGVGDETLGGQSGAGVVPVGEAVAGGVQLTDDAGRHGAQPLVEDVDTGSGDRGADRHARPAGQVGLPDLVDGGEGGVLGRSVAVEQAHAGKLLQHLAAVRRGEDVATRQQTADAAQHVQVLVDHFVEEAGRQPQGGDPAAGEEGTELGDGQGARGCDGQDGPVQQGAPDLEGRRVEGGGRQLGDDVVRAESGVAVVTDQAVDRPVRYDGALGQAGGSGGVDDVGGAVRAGGGGALLVGERGPGQPGELRGRLLGVQHEPGDGAVALTGTGGLPDGHQQRRCRVGQHERDALGRVLGIDRQVGGAGLAHREERHHGFGAARQGDGDEGAAVRAAVQQQPGQAVGPGVEFRIGQLGPFGGQGDRVGGAGRLRLEERGDRGGRGAARRAVELDEEPVAGGRIEDLHVGQRPRGAVAEVVLQGGDEVLGGGAQQFGDGLRVDRRDRVDCETHGGAVVVDGDRERVVGGLPSEDQADRVGFRTGLRRVGRGVPGVGPGGVVAVVEQGGEERGVAGHAAGLLGTGQRGVFVLQQAGELPAHGGHGLPGGAAVEAQPDREGVDEGAGDPVGAGAGVHAAEEDGAEDDVVPAADRGEGPGPGHVHECGGARAQAVRGGAEPGVEFRGEAEPGPDHAEAVAEGVELAVRGGGLGDVAEQFGEVALVLGAFDTAAGLGDEVAEGQRLGQLVGVASEDRRHLVEDELHAGVVLDHVVD
ncbi:hypothetical protein APS67_006647 [Streptomyces sp. AVP053U2]|nr:hypothetical protein APS67_006647 [Streptomyces sp. AVP053U2]